MAKGIMKLHLLKLISMEPSTGYELMGRVEQLTGSRPSSGTVYPHLKDMEAKGWILGQTDDGKTRYHVTTKGSFRLAESDNQKADFLTKVHSSIALASDTFEDVELLHMMRAMDELHPVLIVIMEALHDGFPLEDITAAVETAISFLKKDREAMAEVTGAADDTGVEHHE